MSQGARQQERPDAPDRPEEGPRNVSEWIVFLKQSADRHDAAGDQVTAARLRERARKLEDGIWDNYLDHERESSRAKLREWEAQWAHTRAWQLQNMDGVLDFAQAGLKAYTLVNAGACVALLAFLGNVWTKGVNGEPFIDALAIFAGGVFAAALAAALSYLTQLYYSSDVDADYAVGRRWHKVTGATALLSLVLFACGIAQSVVAFRAQPALRALQSDATTGAIAEATMEQKNQPPPPKPPANPPRPTQPPMPPPPPR